MSEPPDPELSRRLVQIISDAFNRSVVALENAGALDGTKFRKHYTGIGSKYYDVVTEQIELSVRYGAPSIAELFKSKTPPPRDKGDST